MLFVILIMLLSGLLSIIGILYLAGIYKNMKLHRRIELTINYYESILDDPSSFIYGCTGKQEKDIIIAKWESRIYTLNEVLDWFDN